ncbi:MAG TPA: SBBP repeat-containing protein, partial [Myxococcaceae bacterium]|nr:SBBP repeat-containing protein [Myxococcaceae bacterium]
AYLTGYTSSADFPTSPDALQPTGAGGNDAFVAKLNPEGSALVYSSYLGGGGDDFGIGVAVDAQGNVYATGVTYSPEFPVTPDAYQPDYGGGADAFVTKTSAK